MMLTITMTIISLLILSIATYIAIKKITKHRVVVLSEIKDLETERLEISKETLDLQKIILKFEATKVHYYELYMYEIKEMTARDSVDMNTLLEKQAKFIKDEEYEKAAKLQIEIDVLYKQNINYKKK